MKQRRLISLETLRLQGSPQIGKAQGHAGEREAGREVKLSLLEGARGLGQTAAGNLQRKASSAFRRNRERAELAAYAL